MTQPKKSLKNTQGYDVPLYLKDYRLKLDINENLMGPSPKVLEAIKKISEKDIKFYPAYGKLLEKLALFNNTDKNMILPGNGADEIISNIFNAFIEAEDAVLTVTPSFLMPKIFARTQGCEYKEIPYKEKWVFPKDELIQNIQAKTKMIIITTPNNPTGEAISKENLVEILKASEGRYVLIDETYASYAGETFADLIKEYPNILIARSMSKDFGLAGLRFGYLIASQENIGHVKKVISPYSVNNVAVKAAIAALEDKEHLNYCISQVNESKRQLTETLSSLAEEVYRSDANFILVNFGDKNDFIYKKLLKSGIKVKNFENTPLLENCLRIGLPDMENTRYIIESLKPRDLIIFDMDGVMVDTGNSYRLAIRGTYEAFSGKTLTPETVQAAKNRGGLNNDWDLTYYLLEKDGISVTFNEIIDKFQELYWGKDGNGFIKNEKQLISSNSIKELAQKYDLAIFTGRPKKEAHYALDNWGIKQYFSPIITMEDPPAGMGKPNPWGVHEILRITSPREVYYLGDTVDDMFAAKQGGVKGIGVIPPQEKKEELKRILYAHGAVEVLENTEDLLQLLKNFEQKQLR